MTKPRYDSHSTEFGLWLREQSKIDSSLGYVTTNIDFFWKNYLTGKFMLIEEKRYMSEVHNFQQRIFDKIDDAFKSDKDYYGFHLIQFEQTNPEDGKIYLDRKEITKEQLLDFLQFKVTNRQT